MTGCSKCDDTPPAPTTSYDGRELEARLEALARSTPLTNPAEAASNAIRQFLFTVSVYRAIVETGTLSHTHLTPEQIEEVPITYSPSKEAMHAHAWNLLTSALGVTVISLNTCLEQAFEGRAPKPPRSGPPLGDLDMARVLVYMLRNAFAHDPINPKWECRNEYLGEFAFPQLGFTLNTTRLDGQPFDIREIGDLQGFFKLTGFVLQALRGR